MELKADVLSEILNIRIIEKLREEIQGIYGGGTFSNLRKVPYASFQFIVQLPCGPEKVDTLLKALHAEIRQIIENGPKQEDLSKVRQQLLESNNQSLKENTAWSSHLLASRMEGKNIDRFIHFEKYIDKITVKDIQETAQLLLNGKNDYTAILMPAKEEKK
ncbi:MAG: insulinase family protein [Chitinophagaceae bacterium]|nr:insulinase family protein [Chitinophagaceae bacterium]